MSAKDSIEPVPPGNGASSELRANGAARKASTLSVAGRLAGALGLVLLVSMILTWILTQDVGGLLLGKLVFGVLGCVFYLATNLDFFSRAAGGRSAGLLVMTALSTAIVLGLVGIGNYVGSRSALQWDLTRDEIHTLSPQTKGVLRRLAHDVHIYAFYRTSEPLYPVVGDVLEKYGRLTERLEYELVDPETRPDLVQKFQITTTGPRLVISARGQDARAQDLSEEEITHGIIKVAEEAARTFYYLTGHGEPDLNEEEGATGYKALADSIRAEGFGIKPISFVEPAVKAKAGTVVDLNAKENAKLEVPKEVSFLIIAGPKSRLHRPELQAVVDYLKIGGRLLVLLEPNTVTGLETLLGDLGIEVRDDVIVDPNPLNRMIGLGAAAPMVVPTDEKHPITDGLTVTAVMSKARSLGIKNVSVGSGLTTSLVPFLRGGESAWGETAIADGMAEQDERDTNEDLFVGVVATARTEQVNARKVSKEMRLVAFGDSDWLNNQYLPMQGNKDLILNTLNWMVDQADRITIRPRTREASQFSLYGEELNYLKFFSMDILPVLLIAMGLGIVLIRRQR